MAMQYINYIKAKTNTVLSRKSETPVLSDEDERFLTQITSQGQPKPVVSHGGDPQVALMDGAQNIALPPLTPNELTEEPELTNSTRAETSPPKKKSWNWLRRDSRDARNTTANDLQDIASDLKNRTEESPEEVAARKEEEDMQLVLDRLNLAAIDNRVFSVSDETQALLKEFTQVLKDLINGVPTAYKDLESLLTNSDQQIQKTYNSLPSFLQKLVEKLPNAMTASIAPEIMAAASARAASYGVNLEKTGKAAGAASKFMKTPSLKDLITKPTAITGLLRSIVQFLETRFPAFAGVNVLWSMALFLLLIVFWYCYKRGKEARLEKERALTDEEVKKLEAQWQRDHPDSEYGMGRPLPATTTAAPGASIEEVQAGIVEADSARSLAVGK